MSRKWYETGLIWYFFVRIFTHKRINSLKHAPLLVWRSLAWSTPWEKRKASMMVNESHLEPDAKSLFDFWRPEHFHVFQPLKGNQAPVHPHLGLDFEKTICRSTRTEIIWEPEFILYKKSSADRRGDWIFNLPLLADISTLMLWLSLICVWQLGG